MNKLHPIRILIVEDDLDFQCLIKETIESEKDMTVIGCCENPETALSQSIISRPDIVLMDLSLGGPFLEGMEASRNIRRTTDCKVLILTSFEDPDIVIEGAVRGLAHGYVFKSQFEMLVETIRQTAAGVTPQEYMIRSLILSCLSPAEKSVFDIMLGKDVELQSSPKTIANQKTMVLKKLGLGNPGELLHIFGGRHL